MAVFALRSFETHGQAPEADIIEQQTKCFQTNTAFPDMFVTIDSAPQVLFGIVEVESD